MNWYAAHVVMVVRLKHDPQRRFPAWENIVLVSAANEESALAKAEAIGRASAGDDDGSLQWAGKPTTWEFAGVRKVTECALEGPRPASGDEITYSELEFSSRAEARRYAGGAALAVRHTDQFRIVAEGELATSPKTRRKRA